jgi:hypothetical protein
MRNIVMAAIAAVTLAGCASAPSPVMDAPATAMVAPLPAAATEKAGFKPSLSQAAARRVLTANREKMWKDPHSVRSAKIGDAYECLIEDGSTCFCVEANARNSYGGLTGLTMLQARFTGPTQFEMIGAMYQPERCGRMVPFGEING